jgi:hypothetical protein
MPVPQRKVTRLRYAVESALGQGRLWPAGEWHSRSTPSSGNTRAFGHLRFVPIAVGGVLDHLQAALRPRRDQTADTGCHYDFRRTLNVNLR